MKKPQVVIVMGSRSDLKVMSEAVKTLEFFGVPCETQILSAHRTPHLLEQSVKKWEAEGVRVIIAGAGGAAHLPGMLAAFSVIPVVGVPVSSHALNGLDALLSVAQMPRGVPVATVAIDNAVNAGLLAVQIVGGSVLQNKMSAYKKLMSRQVMKDRKSLSRVGVKKFLAAR